ncbi:MAG: hypothetical protein GXO84_00490 [Chlorobi bacterium]|nr:hypothetical protein [Chlorobiota bacterium]
MIQTIKKIFKILALFILVGYLASCRKTDIEVTPIQVGLFTENITVNGIIRRYAIYIPKGLGNSSYPLIFELHGGGVYIEDMTGESGFKTPYKLWMSKADSEKFIVIFPEGLNGTYGKPTWNDCRANAMVSSTANDVNFISKLIDKISASYNININRIYASGTSNGGIMALRLAVELSDRIAAVAATVSAMADSSECGQPINPISVLFMNGTDDNNLPYNGGTIGNPPNPNHGTVFSTETSVNIWTTFNQTDTIPNVYNFPDLDPNDGGTVLRYIYSNGNEGTEVVLYKVLGGGHSAPSILEQYSLLFEQSFGRQNHDIEMTTEVWIFFKDKTL